jgi:hypothetical protein
VRGLLEDRGDARRWPRLDRREIALLLLGTLFAASASYYALANRNADPDLFWHSANGREMIQTQSIPQYDSMSWYGIEKNLRISTQEWLYDFWIFQVFRAGGFRLVYLWTALLFGGTFLAVYALGLTRTRRHLPSLTVAALAIIGLLPSIAPRPQAVSYLLLVVVAVLLERRQWLAVLPLVVLAANVHGGTFPIFIGVIAFYAYREKPWLVLAALACVAVNPQTLSMLWFPIRGTFGGITTPIQEWYPPTLTGRPILFATLLALVLLLRNRKVPLDTGVLAIAIGLLSLMGGRYGVYVYLLAIPLLLPYVLHAPASSSAASASHTVRDSRSMPAPRWLQSLLAAEMVLGVALMVALGIRTPIDVDTWYPKLAVAYMKEHGIDRVFNHYNDGGYLVFHEIPTLIDGRAIQFGPMFNEGEDLFFRYFEVIDLKADYRQFLRLHDIQHLMLPKYAQLYQVLTHDSRVETLYEDETHVVMRTDPAIP